MGASILASATQAQDRFDLNCRVDVVGTSPTPRFDRSGRERLKIRIDIPNRRFCFDDCDQVETLTILEGAIRGSSGDVTFLVRRRSGEMEFLRRGLFSGAGFGVCDTASFSGFPRRGFGNPGPAAIAPARQQPAPPAQTPELSGPRPYQPGRPMPAAPPTQPAPPRPTTVQIGAFVNVDIAREELQKVTDGYGQFLAGSRVSMQEVTAASGHQVIRTMFVDLSPENAAGLCRAMKANGRDCILR